MARVPFRVIVKKGDDEVLNVSVDVPSDFYGNAIPVHEQIRIALAVANAGPKEK